MAAAPTAAEAAAAQAVATLVHWAEVFPAAVPALLPCTVAAVRRARGRRVLPLGLLQQQVRFLVGHGLLPPVAFEVQPDASTWTFRGLVPGWTSVAVTRRHAALDVHVVVADTLRLAELPSNHYACSDALVDRFVDTLGTGACVTLLPYLRQVLMPARLVRPYRNVLARVAARVSPVGAAQVALVRALVHAATAAAARAALLAAAAAIPGGVHMFAKGWLLWRPDTLWDMWNWVCGPVRWVMVTAGTPPPKVLNSLHGFGPRVLLHLAGAHTDAFPPTKFGAAMAVFTPKFPARLADQRACRWTPGRAAWATDAAA